MEESWEKSWDGLITRQDGMRQGQSGPLHLQPSAKALDLNEEKTSQALAIAASGASGIRENFGTMVKSLRAGQAAATGVLAALLAEKGYEGSATAIEGKLGFWYTFSGETEIGLWADALKKSQTLMEIMFKRYPSCAGTHPVLDALEELMKEYPFSWEEVEEVECLVSPLFFSILTHHEPNNGLEAKFSLEYCVSAFLVYGKLVLSHFEKEAVANPEVRGLMKRVKMVPSEELGRLLKAKNLLAPTEIQVKMKKGILSKRILEARGGPSFPLQDKEIKEKFRNCAGRILSAEKVEKAIELISSLESLGQVNSLTGMLNP